MAETPDITRKDEELLDLAWEQVRRWPAPVAVEAPRPSPVVLKRKR